MSRLRVWRPGNRWSIPGRGRNDSVPSSAERAVALLSHLFFNRNWGLLLSCNVTLTWNWPLTSIWCWFYLRISGVIPPHPQTSSWRAALSTGEILHSCFAQQWAAIICASVMQFVESADRMSKPQIHSALQTGCSSRLLPQGNFGLSIAKGSLRIVVAYMYNIPVSRTAVIVPGKSGLFDWLIDAPLSTLCSVSLDVYHANKSNSAFKTQIVQEIMKCYPC